ncbi:MAG: general secretion pathway protein H [Maricaulis sp.]|jgi:general secretion pathway protein H
MRTRLPRDAGISLIEILVGISILAIVAFAVTLSVQPSGDVLRDEAERLAIRLDQAGQEAIATGQPVGLTIAGEGYAFYRYLDGRWWALEDHPTLRARVLPNDVRIDLRDGYAGFEPGEGAVFPAFWFDPAGLSEPFLLRLQSEGRSIELERDQTGAIALHEVG